MPSISSNDQSSAASVPSPSNPVLIATQSQWFFTDAELLRSPSVLDGMAPEAEHTSRGKGVNFIMQVGIMLKIPQLTLCTASVYLHRFFMRYSMVDLPQRPGMHPYSVAATALFLATKVEENCRKMKELIVACCRVALKQPNVVIDEQSKEFWKWRDTILHNEDLLLEALCFDLQLEQPYRLLYDFLCFFNQQYNTPLRNSAWAFINDSMFTVLCLQFQARTIAAGALYAAARHCDVSFPDDDAGRPWWEQIDVDLGDLKRACNKLAELYEKSPLPKPGQKYPSIPGNEGESPDKTRQIIERTSENGGYQDRENGSLSPGEISERKRSREPEERMSSKELEDSESRAAKRPKLEGSEGDASLPISQTQSQAGSQASPTILPKDTPSQEKKTTNGPNSQSKTPSQTDSQRLSPIPPPTISKDHPTSHPANTNQSGHSNITLKPPLDGLPPRPIPLSTGDKPPSSRVPASYRQRQRHAVPSRPPPKPPLT